MEMESKKVAPKVKRKFTGRDLFVTFTEGFYAALNVVTLFVLVFLTRDAIKVRKELLEGKPPSYPFPTFFSLFYALGIFIFLMLFKYTFELFCTHFTPKIMAEKYRNPKNHADYETSLIVPGKLARHIYKITMYIFLTIFGFYVLKDRNYFPKNLLGHGEMKNMFLPGYPDSYFQPRTKSFDFFYLTSLAVSVSDLLFLIKQYGKQSDFFNMLLHHICTVSLIFFSYIINYSSIGAIVLFIHNLSDLPNHVTKFLLRTDAPEIFINISGISFLLGFLYFRIYVFFGVISTIYNYITWTWSWVTFSLNLFLIFLYIMDAVWTMILLFKFVKLLFHEKITDNVTYSTEEAKNEKEDDKKQN